MTMTDLQSTPFFHRGPRPITRYVVFAVLSFLLLGLDGRFEFLITLRQSLAVVVYPLRQAALAPMLLYTQVRDFFVTQSQLKSENTALRVRHLRDSAQLQRYATTQRENQYLRKLLGARQQPAYRSVLAEVLYAGQDAFRRKMTINKGTLQGIALGAVVIDDVGVVGQVTQVLPLSSEVTLLTDKDQTVPIEIARSGQRGIVFGLGHDGALELRFMPVSSDIQPGDVLVTSGLDDIYPRGLPVARVVKIARPVELAFATVTAVPLAGVGRHNEVLILLPEAATTALTSKGAQ